jgi:hypothetical protein
VSGPGADLCGPGADVCGRVRPEPSLRRIRSLPRSWPLLLTMLLWAPPLLAEEAPGPFSLSERKIPGRGIDGFAVVDEEGRERLAIVSIEGMAPRELRFVSWLPGQTEQPLASIGVPREVVAVDAAELGLAAGPELVWVSADEIRIVAMDGRTLRSEAIAPPLPLPTRTWELARYPLIRDWDGDGRLELLLPRANSVTLHPLVAGDAPQNLAVPWTADYGSPTLENWFRPGLLTGLYAWPTMAIGDDDGDGRADLYAATRFELLVFRGGAYGLPTEPSQRRVFKPFSEEEERRRVASTLLAYPSDLDADGRTDLLVHRMVGSLLRSHAVTSAYRNTGTGPDPQAEPWTRLESRGGTAAVELLDIDGDGRLELLEAHIPFGVLQAIRVLTLRRIETQLRVLALPEQAGEPLRETFKTGVTFPFDFDTSRVQGVLPHIETDWNADGFSDLCWGDGSGELTFRLGEARPEGPGYGRVAEQDLDGSGELVAADLDGDGLPDFAIYDPLDRGGTLRIGMNRGVLPGTRPGLRASPESD